MGTPPREPWPPALLPKPALLRLGCGQRRTRGCSKLLGETAGRADGRMAILTGHLLLQAKRRPGVTLRITVQAEEAREMADVTYCLLKC